MKLKNKKYDTDGDKRLSQKGIPGETDGNVPSRWSNDIIDTDISPVESFPWSQLCEMRKTLEKPVKSKKLAARTSLQNSQDLVTKCTASNGSYYL